MSACGREHLCRRALHQHVVTHGVAERVVDHLELVEVEAMQREQTAVSFSGAKQMFELLLKHGAVRQSGEHVIERQLRDPLLALDDLAGHFVEARRQPRQLVVAAHPHLNMLARGQPAGGLVEASERLRNSPRRTPRREGDEEEAEQRHDGERELQFARIGERFGLGVSEQKDCALAVAESTGLFQRGETQVLSVLTLGMPRMEQFIGLDELRGTKKRYIHHYNFPPYSTGETGRVGSPKRREIGHGALAERALVPVVPSMEEWPYVLRIVSDVLSSNGSTSMASVCGSTLSMLDGGVPLKASVAGIAMGLVYAEGKYTTLTDILGTEDTFGDMDFKVAGTRDFVTALQLDTKIDGLPSDVLRSGAAAGPRRPPEDPRRHGRRDRHAPRRREAQRTEDRQLRDPDGQDR